MAKGREQSRPFLFMVREPRCQVWTFTGLYGVEMGVEPETSLGDGFYLSKPTNLLLSGRSRFDLSEREFQEVGRVDVFLVHREMLPVLRGPERSKKTERFQNGLMALQILKPLKTSGYIFQGKERSPEQLELETIRHPPPMQPGEWARTRHFDANMIDQLRELIPKVLARMESGSAEEKNGIYLLQLSLEHSHPLIKGMLSVMGLDALLEMKPGEGREHFKKKLRQHLGDSTLAFPDWHSPRIAPPKYTIADVALPLYTLRGKVAHGVDLRKAASDKNNPVRLTERVKLVKGSKPMLYAALLSEAAMYILCLMIQNTLVSA